MATTHVLVQYHTRHRQKLAKVTHIDAASLVLRHTSGAGQQAGGAAITGAAHSQGPVHEQLAWPCPHATSPASHCPPCQEPRAMAAPVPNAAHLRKVDARLLKQLDRVLCIHVIGQPELPAGQTWQRWRCTRVKRSWQGRRHTTAPRACSAQTHCRHTCRRCSPNFGLQSEGSRRCTARPAAPYRSPLRSMARVPLTASAAAAARRARRAARTPRSPEVELPHAQLAVDARQVAVCVRKGQPQLDQLEHVHVQPA